eukprot:TRINITY_DN574_c0_g1_i2.p1 TRINITY_DN574_c0_g1~~TRINITY_DN574_c0_g1_i2.p1  ORF type:complete len:125 (-),score=28.81 TRINITY_DN574_c0_g1_i2:273-608(-)
MQFDKGELETVESKLVSQRPFPVISADPSNSQVFQAFRFSDYATILGFTGGSLLAAYWLPQRVRQNRWAIRILAFNGILGGVLVGYARASSRLVGTSENGAELKKFGKVSH